MERVVAKRVLDTGAPRCNLEPPRSGGVARNASNVHSRCGLFQSANPGSSLRRELEDFRRLRSLVRLAAWPWSCGLGTGTVTALAFGILQFLVVSGVTAFQPAVHLVANR